MTSFGSPIPIIPPTLKRMKIQFLQNQRSWYEKTMDQSQDPEMGRFFPKGDPNEPMEPLIPEEEFRPKYEPETPRLKSLHIPKAPIKKGVLKAFLIELRPVIKEIQAMSRKEQHLLGRYLQDVKKALYESDFPKKVCDLFEKMASHFNDLLTHSEPADQEAVLEKLSELEATL